MNWKRSVDMFSVQFTIGIQSKYEIGKLFNSVLVLYMVDDQQVTDSHIIGYYESLIKC